MYGTPVKTFYAFKIYLERIEELIATTPKRWIDATEGGAFKEGSEIRTLREVIQEFHGRNHSIWDRIRSIQPGTDKGKYCCTACFEGAMQRIRLIAEQLHKVASGQVGEETAGEIWQRFVMDEDMRMMLDHAVFRFQIYPEYIRCHRKTLGVPADTFPEASDHTDVPSAMGKHHPAIAEDIRPLKENLLWRLMIYAIDLCRLECLQGLLNIPHQA